ncbi:hypothetical protein RB195_020110 [Necator americanus]|uniref:Secreted protein n=1 Tax=Necator americanus TaxID=51031 RepID=A0ABR1CIU5_NECAM
MATRLGRFSRIAAANCRTLSGCPAAAVDTEFSANTRSSREESTVGVGSVVAATVAGRNQRARNNTEFRYRYYRGHNSCLP